MTKSWRTVPIFFLSRQPLVHRANSGTKPFYRPPNRPLLHFYNAHAQRASHFTTYHESWHISYMCIFGYLCSIMLWKLTQVSLRLLTMDTFNSMFTRMLREIYSTSKVERLALCHATGCTELHEMWKGNCLFGMKSQCTFLILCVSYKYHCSSPLSNLAATDGMKPKGRWSPPSKKYFQAFLARGHQKF